LRFSSALFLVSLGCKFSLQKTFAGICCTDDGNRAASVNPALVESVGNANKLYYMFYFWGYTSAFVVYVVLSYFFPATETQIPATIYDDTDVISGEVDKDSDLPDEKLGGKVESSPV